MEGKGRERLRYQVLECFYQQVGQDCTEILSAFSLPDELDVPREEVFAAVEYLARRQYIHHVGAGPRICITEAGLQILRGPERRRSVRDERSSLASNAPPVPSASER